MNLNVFGTVAIEGRNNRVRPEPYGPPRWVISSFLLFLHGLFLMSLLGLPTTFLSALGDASMSSWARLQSIQTWYFSVLFTSFLLVVSSACQVFNILVSVVGRRLPSCVTGFAAVLWFLMTYFVSQCDDIQRHYGIHHQKYVNGICYVLFSGLSVTVVCVVMLVLIENELVEKVCGYNPVSKCKKVRSRRNRRRN